MHTVYCHYLASNCCLTSSVGVFHTYCVLPLTYSLDLLFNVKCRSCTCILCIAINLQARLCRSFSLLCIAINLQPRLVV